jgi:hypothetical protein
VTGAVPVDIGRAIGRLVALGLIAVQPGAGSRASVYQMAKQRRSVAPWWRMFCRRGDARQTRWATSLARSDGWLGLGAGKWLGRMSGRSPFCASHQFYRSMIIAMAIMWVMQSSVHEVIDVITVGYTFVPTVRPVSMRAPGARRAPRRIGVAHLDNVFVDVISMHMMQVPSWM